MHRGAIERSAHNILCLLIEEQGHSNFSLEHAVAVCQTADSRLQRVKKKPLAEVIDTVLERIKKELRSAEDNTDSADIADIADADVAGGSDSGLMTVRPEDSNKMNQSIKQLWSHAPADMEKLSVRSDKSSRHEKDKDKAKDEKAVAREEKPRHKKRKIESKRPASSVRLADIGGIDNIVTQILELLAMPLSHPEVYAQLGSDIPRGVLLHGPPGCGKTMLANAIANELGVHFINVSAPSVVSGMSGESEKKLRDIFDEAIEMAPSLIFIDEIDAITPKRENVQREMERRIVAQLLTSMDDVALEKTGGRPVMIIGATNRPDSIDPALRRGGRFDHEIALTVPDQDAREKILRTMSRKLKVEGTLNFTQIAKSTPGFVGADLNALVSAAGVAAIKRIFRDMGSTASSVVTDNHTGLRDSDIEVPDGDEMEVEKVAPAIAVTDATPTVEGTVPTAPLAPVAVPNSVDAMKPTSLISQFLAKHPEPLTPEQLEPLAITYADFVTAIPQIQPSSKREGFATVPDVTWEDVGAMTEIREELEYAIVAPIQRPEVYARAGISAPSGVLLWGPPGCGKTLLAKAVANESKANFISIRGPELLNKYVGESERAVRQVFVRARASTPCVIFFDELDALVPRRDDSNSESASRVVNTLLTELDGVGARQGVFVIAATNRPDMIDAAMLRPGRLDKQLFVELPNPNERAEILRTVCRRAPLNSNVDLVALAHDERCRNFSGADLAALVREASVLALKAMLRETTLGEDPIVVDANDFERAYAKVRPSVNDAERQKYYAMRDRMSS